eukprot:3850399-Amphidinium_carterae.1
MKLHDISDSSGSTHLQGAGGAPMAGGSDEIVLKASLRDPDWQQGWEWVRPQADIATANIEGLEWQIYSGGLWGNVFPDSPPCLLLRAAAAATACEVSVKMPPPPATFGEQGGLF